ncbi:MAG: hypothetical protein KZQ66_17975 [Candidatus Thiodiazotropha sp. (ex Lucinoma aequizonata)]|nr:hypothetical protein [Candidatus Thiodiazotropha sp. (ex Lucinoma aequizonata)]MCU7903636.1 hypothetical protein [Candidatus Thiodiazotropha sp. (ex Lucinoma aequizonata)]
MMDIYSRKIVGWEIHENETADYASLLIRKACCLELLSNLVFMHLNQAAT